MGYREKNNMAYYTFEHLERTGLVNHCFTTRLGGVSKGVYESFNLSFTRGESRETVLENYKILCGNLGFDYESFVLPYQTHTTHIRRVTLEDKGKGVTMPSDIRDTDGLITNVPGLNLTVFGADCVPIFLLDTGKKAIATIHAGWRGTAMGIAKKAVEKMVLEYGTNPIDILAGIGPSIGKCCFQVDEPVVRLFRENLLFADQVIFEDNEPGKYKIDLWQTNRLILKDAGIPVSNIEISAVCTMCDTHQFYSHRKMGDARGNMAGVMTLL